MRRNVLVQVLGLVLGVVSPALADLSDDAFKMWLKQLTRSKKASERAEAASSLGSQGRPEAVAPLAQALSDTDPLVRSAAAAALWEMGETAMPAEAALWKALDDADLGVVVHAAGALAVLDADRERLAPARRRALAAPDLSTRFLAARGLVGVDAPAGLLPHVLEYLEVQAGRYADPKADHEARDAAEHNRKLATEALGDLVATQDRALVAPLVERVGRDHPAQAMILDAMGGLDPAPEGWDELLAASMGARETRTRSVAAELAGKRTAPEQAKRWVAAATRLLADPDDGVRSRAVWALGEADGLAAEAVPALIDRLAKEPDPDDREKIAEVLGDIGDRTQPVAQQTKLEVAAKARPALEKALATDPDSDVRRAALRSLDRIALDAAEAVAILARTARDSRDDELTWSALQGLRNRGLEAVPALETIRALEKHADPQTADYAATIARELSESLARKPGGGAAGATSAVLPATATSSGRGAAVPSRAPDPGTEARGLAVLRARDEELSETAFKRALMNADAELVEAYLDAGMAAGRPFADENERGPLHLLFFFREACDAGVRPTAEAAHTITRLLLARGADVNAVDENQNTALMFAADKCDASLLGELIAGGAKVDARNGSGLTALEMTLWSGNDGLQALIKAGARLAPDKAAAYREAYKANPKAVALVELASKK